MGVRALFRLRCRRGAAHGLGTNVRWRECRKRGLPDRHLRRAGSCIQSNFRGGKGVEAIAVVTVNGGSPCGSCRQVLAEFGLQTVVLLADGDGKLLCETTVADLLPNAFRPQDLKTKV